MYELYKVFDYQKMPKEVKSAAFSVIDDCSTNICNGMYFDWSEFLDVTEKDYDEEYVMKFKVTNDWLFENGATPQDKVLINYWW